jgi:N-glycosylase/DNA lyase
MRTSAPRYAGVDELRREFRQKKDAIHRRLDDFAAVRPEDYFYELVYCLLTPQSSAVNAGKAVEALKAEEQSGASVDVAELLRRRAHYIRFHNTKARHLTAAREKFPEIAAIIIPGSPGHELRAWLVGNVRGLGWKEASHFLRNIGHRDLAILDRHILKNLLKHAVLRSIPATLTPKRYLAIEARFARFAAEIGMSIDELDLLFWSRETGEILK